MRKQVSTPFAIIAIVFALIMGGLYFMWQYNTQEVKDQRERDMLRKQANTAMAKRSGGGKSSIMRAGIRRGGRTGASSKRSTPGPASTSPGGATSSEKTSAPSTKAPAAASTTPAAAAAPATKKPGTK